MKFKLDENLPASAAAALAGAAMTSIPFPPKVSPALGTRMSSLPLPGLAGSWSPWMSG